MEYTRNVISTDVTEKNLFHYVKFVKKVFFLKMITVSHSGDKAKRLKYYIGERGRGVSRDPQK